MGRGWGLGLVDWFGFSALVVVWEGSVMTIEIYRPESEALLAARMASERSGFQYVIVCVTSLVYAYL